MSINTNDKVKVVNPLLDFFGETGTVINTYNVTPDNVAIVRLDCGITTKIRFDSLNKIEAQAEQDSEIPEGARVITKAEFKTAIETVTNLKNHFGESDNNMSLSMLLGSMAAKVVAEEISNKLFDDSDDVTLNEDRLTMIIWNGCNPENVSASVKGGMSIRKSLSVSLAAIIPLRKLVGYFFPESVEGLSNA